MIGRWREKLFVIGAVMLLGGCGESSDDTSAVKSTTVADDLLYQTALANGLTLEQQKVVLLHNEKRNLYFSDMNLSYSMLLEEEAQRYANLLAENGTFEHEVTFNHAQDYGENLYAYSKDEPLGIEDAMPHWFDEEMPLYNYADGSCREAYYPDGTLIKCGHYTQVIWQETQEVGCATAQYTAGSMTGGYVYVCKYQKAGNIEGEKPYCSNYSNADIYLLDKPERIALANQRFSLEFREEDRTNCTKRDYFNGAIRFSADLTQANLEEFTMSSLTYNNLPAQNDALFDRVDFDGETIYLKGINSNIPAESYQEKPIFMNIKIIGENDAYFSAEVEWNLLDEANSLYTRKMKAKLYKENPLP